MYIVVGYNVLTGKREIYQETKDARVAYDVAHELDCAYNLGRDESDTSKKDYRVHVAIENEYGRDMWQECSYVRTPSIWLFQ